MPRANGWDEGHGYDVIVVGAGHAGCEAALACARMGMRVAVFSISLDSVANMPCNPSIGGTSKGCLVREVDALGGEMGKAADATTIQSRMLNRSKGPAVHSLRAQIDRREYQKYMKAALESQDGLDLRQAEIAELLVGLDDAPAGGNGPFAGDSDGDVLSDSGSLPACDDAGDALADSGSLPACDDAGDDDGGNGPFAGGGDALVCGEGMRRVIGVRTHTGAVFGARAVILATGTYLRARVIIGDYSRESGPDGLFPAVALSGSLRALGVDMMRFKTGTPARVHMRSLDAARMERQDSDDPIHPFSFETAQVEASMAPCWITHTNERTHEIIRANLDRSPLFSGAIEGVGARYCPSIEDKVVRFPGRASHQVFVEPTGNGTQEMYLAGFSSSMPEDVQERMIRSVAGLEGARLMRSAYAIEYDCINPMQLHPTLEFRSIAGLFSAGQINGTSGYEEAAAQGVLAGINAALSLRGEPGLVIGRQEGYVGVMIDDLVTKGVNEPYRMMTARAEYRLLLRQDNADARLTPYGREAGLIDDRRYASFLEKREAVAAEKRRLESTAASRCPALSPDSMASRCSASSPDTPASRCSASSPDTPASRCSALSPDSPASRCSASSPDTPASHGVAVVRPGATLADLLKQPGVSYGDLLSYDPSPKSRLSRADAIEQLEISVKYAGYIARQMRDVEQARKLEGRKLPPDAAYASVSGLSVEAAQKLDRLRPESIGQAARIPGVTPADVSVLLVWLARETGLRRADGGAAMSALESEPQ